MKKIRLGIIGLGYIGKIHLLNCAKVNNGEVSAVADVSKNALSRAKRLGVKSTYTDYSKLIEKSDVDAVVIALPTHLHESCARIAAENDKSIFMEKPLARNAQEGEGIVSLAKKAKVKLMVGYYMRFLPCFTNLRDELQSGIFGEIRAAHAINVSSGPFFHRSEGYIPKPVPDWWFQKDLTGGGALIDLGVHVFNLLRWYFGRITDITSKLDYKLNMDVEDGATCLVNFASGPTATVNVGWYAQEYQLQVEFLGTVKNAVARNVPPSKIVSAIQLLAMGYSRFYLPYLAELNHFVNCVMYDKKPRTSGEDALEDLRAIDLAYRNGITMSA